MPLTAKLTNQISVLRAMSTNDNAHSSSGYWMVPPTHRVVFLRAVGLSRRIFRPRSLTVWVFHLRQRFVTRSIVPW